VEWKFTLGVIVVGDTQTMSLPQELWYLRHAESQRNQIRELVKQGKLSRKKRDTMLEVILSRPTAIAPLTDFGKRQAAKTDEWLQANNIVFDNGQYGIVEAGTHGWGSPDFYVPLIISIALFVLFTLIETRWASAPLVPFKAITKPLADANTIVFVFSAALFPMWFVTSLYLQEVLGLSPLNAGLVFFPMAVVFGIPVLPVSRIGNNLQARWL